jgi:peptide/nickel transport system permease protein
LRKLLHNPAVLFGGVIIAIVLLMGLLAPWLGTIDPTAINPIARNKVPGAEFTLRTDTGERIKMIALFGTDGLGRDVYSRVVYGARISLTVGISVALLSTTVGLAIGMLAGFSRPIDAIVMRVMDGLMSIPAVLVAIALMAITISEVPRVSRLVRGVVLSLREQPFVEAARATGTRFLRILLRHILPNTVAPLLVQGTYICASAIITEAILSFLGAGTPPNIPSWGNIMAEGRSLFQVAAYIILFPGLCLSLTVLAVNLVGDGLRDALDPRLARRM